LDLAQLALCFIKAFSCPCAAAQFESSNVPGLSEPDPLLWGQLIGYRVNHLRHHMYCSSRTKQYGKTFAFFESDKETLQPFRGRHVHFTLLFQLKSVTDASYTLPGPSFNLLS
jgi:hypothetical protein